MEQKEITDLYKKLKISRNDQRKKFEKLVSLAKTEIPITNIKLQHNTHENGK